MFKIVEYGDLDNTLNNYALIDVRTPKEYKESTIPGAINIPLFLDEERKEIGYVYVNESVEKAKAMGIEAVSKRLPEIYSEITKLHKENRNLVFFCARGGMRSASITSLITSLGMNAYRIRGGYKGYREFINKELPKENEKIKYIVIHGKTGVGKTEILKKLRENGHDVLDLEWAANHRGSLLGSVGIGEPRTQKMFETLVYEQLKERKTNYVFVEGESKRIGNIIIPTYIFNSMSEGYHIYVESDIESRVSLLLEEYTKAENAKNEILDALDNMSKYISEKRMSLYRGLAIEENYKELCIELMINYYDSMYLNSMKKHSFDVKMEISGVEDGVRMLESWVNSNIGEVEEL